MAILLSTTILIVFFALIKNNHTNIEKENKIFFILTAIILIVVSGLRSRYTGTTDTDAYATMFENLSAYTSFNTYFAGIYEKRTFFIFSEYAFHLFCYLLSRISNNPQLLILVTSTINVLATLFFIKNNSKNTEVSTVGFICLGSFTFAMNGMRQSLAMSICLLSFEFVKKKKFIPFLLIVVLATLFHKTAFVFLIVYFAHNIKWNRFNIVVLPILLATFAFCADEITVIFDEATGKEYTSGESFSSGGIVTILIYLLCIVLTLLKPKTLKNNNNIRTAFILSLFGLFLYLARYFVIDIYERVSYYFFFFILILLSSIVDESENKNLMRLLVITLSVFLFAYRLIGSSFENFKFFFM